MYEADVPALRQQFQPYSRWQLLGPGQRGGWQKGVVDRVQQ
jgi:hypothetical protein